MMRTLTTWIKDHCQWYRRAKGGKWYQWNGFWEQPNASGWLYYLRGYKGVDMMEGVKVWSYKQTLDVDSKYIAAREDYTPS